MPVAGSSLPNRLLCWPVHQSEPSGATAGSCGPELGVGTLHSRIVTSGALAGLPAGRAANVAEYRSAALKITAALLSKILFVFMAAPFFGFCALCTSHVSSAFGPPIQLRRSLLSLVVGQFEFFFVVAQEAKNSN